MKHLIFDLETLAQGPDSVVLSIAILAFDFHTPVTTADGVQLKLDVIDQVKNYKRVIDQSTVEWWKKQSEEAREILKPCAEDANVREACTILNEVIASFDEYDYKNSYVFSRGHYFDFPILDSLYSNAEIKPRFNGWRVRDVRTFLETCEMFAEASDVVIDYSDIGKNNHNALDDCVADANRMIRTIGAF